MVNNYQPEACTMKLHIVSDLHTEFADFTPPDTDADVVVLAGDIGVGTAGVEWAARRFRRTPVLYVPGNHEYHDHDIRIGDDLRAAAPDHIHVLDTDALELGGVRFLGTREQSLIGLFCVDDRGQVARQTTSMETVSDLFIEANVGVETKLR